MFWKGGKLAKVAKRWTKKYGSKPQPKKKKKYKDVVKSRYV